MIRHIVLFELGGFDSMDAQIEHLRKIKESLEALPRVIGSLENLHVSFNQNPEEPYSFLLEATVKDLSALRDYSEHPAHIAVVKELIAPYKRGRAAIDIEE